MQRRSRAPEFRGALRLSLVPVILVLAGAMAASAAASPAICGEYPDLPACQEDPGGGGGPGGGNGHGPGGGHGHGPGGGGHFGGSPNGGDASGSIGGGAGAGAGGLAAARAAGVATSRGSTRAHANGNANDESAAGGTGFGGEVPLTDYPLTTLLLVVLVLLAIALAVRGGIALRDRFRGTTPPTASPGA